MHIGVLSTGDKVPSPNFIQNNGEDGISVIRASTARIIGNTLSGNRRNGLTVQINQNEVLAPQLERCARKKTSDAELTPRGPAEVRRRWPPPKGG